ncbi:ABC transporter ATP-binding protein, partial [Streptomyces broussonetiae]
FTDSLRDLLRPRPQRAHEARLRVDAALAAAGLDLESLPKGSRTAVRDLERLQELRLSVALALLGRPGLLGVDDIDLKLSDAERAEAWDLLRSLTRAGTTVAAVCRTAPADCVAVRTGAKDAEARGDEDAAAGASDDTDDEKSDPEEDADALA